MSPFFCRNSLRKSLGLWLVGRSVPFPGMGMKIFEMKAKIKLEQTSVAEVAGTEALRPRVYGFDSCHHHFFSSRSLRS